ncbi:DNA-3-methyladenine glycosylase I [Pseudoalteromonas ulvae UL12]|uniref:DNA-3-methyladenine glycosylase n=1 Tax=Pseudoalteromonas ulvae TaxID=107327 RepID=A0A244CKV4_PSEDV|nr:DNA-3-methyladenine glycosylase I [Pseudoalteromonas ulvae UL12]OUL55994.1 DNA-3-methyladenine glycosylase [Pseudoalteromonas ulvae]
MMPNSICRCPWVDLTKPDYVKYHDEEWGVPVYDDVKMFEFIVLESAQAGLSWYTILKRREQYRAAFAQFDVEQVAQFSQQKVEALLQDEGIIRHRGKINAAITNAQVFMRIQQEFGSFSEYLWRYVDHQPIVNAPQCKEDYLANSELSDRISRDLKKRGFKFFGSTICYAHLQACGLIIDHSLDCFKYNSDFTQR